MYLALPTALPNLVMLSSTYMADSPNGDHSNVQDISEGKLNGGHKRSGVMIRIHLDRLICADSVITILPANYPSHKFQG